MINAPTLVLTIQASNRSPMRRGLKLYADRTEFAGASSRLQTDPR